MMAAPITYIFTGERVDLTAAAAAWYFPANPTVSVEQITKLAAALGVTGDVIELSADKGSGWMVGSTDYTGPSLTVSKDAMLSWWYSPGPGDAGMVECSVSAVDPQATQAGSASEPAVEPGTDPGTDPAATVGGSTESTFVEVPMEICTPSAPANVPTKEQAEQKARDLFAALGMPSDALEFETYADEWSANVTAYNLIEGSRGVSMGVGFGGEGVLQWASGSLATAQRGGDYPRIGIDAAIERLNDQSSWIYAGVGGGGLLRSTDSGTATAEPAIGWQDTEPVGNEAPAPPATDVAVASDEMPIDRMPIDCVGGPAVDCAPIEIEPMTIELSNPRPSLEMIWDADGTIWLLPGYAFDSADGGWYSVIAIDDSFINIEQPVALPEPAPLPVETIVVVPGETSPPVPEPIVDTVPAVPAPDAAACPEVVIPTDVTQPGASVESGAGYIGLCIADAQRLAEATGYEVRVARQDGEDLAVTLDLRGNRYNVAVVNGVVTEILSVG